MTPAARPRQTARVLLVDDRGRILLFCGRDPGRPESEPFWFCPGGGIELGESPADAARRELEEETGLFREDLGEVVVERRLEHEFDGVRYDQLETYFLVRTRGFEIDTSRWTAGERAYITEHKWWTREEVHATTAAVYPSELAAFLDSLDVVSD